MHRQKDCCCRIQLEALPFTAHRQTDLLSTNQKWHRKSCDFHDQSKRLWPRGGWRKLGKETTLGLFRQQKPGRESQHAMAKGKGECQQRPPNTTPTKPTHGNTQLPQQPQQQQKQQQEQLASSSTSYQAAAAAAAPATKQQQKQQQDQLLSSSRSSSRSS